MVGRDNNLAPRYTGPGGRSVCRVKLEAPQVCWHFRLRLPRGSGRGGRKTKAEDRGGLPSPVPQTMTVGGSPALK